MIGIVILGFGLIMVATMFPVAWTRARALSEFTVERAITENAHTTIGMLTRVSSISREASSFEGDPLCGPTGPTGPIGPIGACVNVRSDDRVHALHLENVQVERPRGFVDEDSWKLADPDGLLEFVRDQETGLNSGDNVVDQSYFRKRINFQERVFPPMAHRDDVDLATGKFTGPDDRWDDELDTRRFGWAVFHRLRAPVVDDSERITPAPCVTDELGRVRSFDMYYVTLRRGQSTHRYARQNPNKTPNPCVLGTSPAPAPDALGPGEDVMFPVAWRVQVEFLMDPNPVPGIPTEIVIPPNGSGFNDSQRLMLIQMFQRGTRFIDEINGEVYEVLDQRVSAAADQATLTLDREVLFDDLNIPDGDNRCEPCDDTSLIPQELLRTVWVFPPPVEPRASSSDPIIFKGKSPALAIDVRTLNVAPN